MNTNHILKDEDLSELNEMDFELLEEVENISGTDHYLLSDGKTYIVILCVIMLCGAISISNIFFPTQKEKVENQNQKGINGRNR